MSGAGTPARSFGQFVAEAEDGQLHADLSRELEAIVAALDERIRAGASKAKGTLTLTLSFTLDNHDVCEVDAALKTKLPQAERARSIFWVTPENHLSRFNPRQQSLPLHDVKTSREVI